MLRTFLPVHVGDRIRRARKARGWPQSRLAEEVGVGQTTVASWESGRTEPSREMTAKAALALGVPHHELELDLGPEPPAPRTVPVVSYIGAGGQAHLFAEGQGPFDQVSAPEDATDKTVAARVQGTSIGRMYDGWLVFYDDERLPPSRSLFGQLCAVGLPDGRILVKWLEPAENGRFH